jgi:hypothetical protein
MPVGNELRHTSDVLSFLLNDPGSPIDSSISVARHSVRTKAPGFCNLSPLILDAFNSPLDFTLVNLSENTRNHAAVRPLEVYGPGDDRIDLYRRLVLAVLR